MARGDGGWTRHWGARKQDTVLASPLRRDSRWSVQTKVPLIEGQVVFKRGVESQAGLFTPLAPNTSWSFNEQDPARTSTRGECQISRQTSKATSDAPSHVQQPSEQESTSPPSTTLVLTPKRSIAVWLCKGEKGTCPHVDFKAIRWQRRGRATEKLPAGYTSV